MTLAPSAARLSEIAAQAEKIATLARALADAETERAKDLAGFHKASAARHAATLLLDCRSHWLSRSEIAEASGCRPNAVVAVVQRLRGNGVTVERRTVNGQAQYRAMPEEYV